MITVHVLMGLLNDFYAVWLRDAAQSALEASINASWIEPSLVHAASVRHTYALLMITPH
jgi:hypothetical protein